MLENRGAPEAIAARFFRDGQGIGLPHGSEQEGDTAFRHEGRPVLQRSAQVSKLLADDTLEVQGAKLTLIRPKQPE